MSPDPPAAAHPRILSCSIRRGAPNGASFRAIAPSTSALLVQLRAASFLLAVLASASLVVPVTLSRKQPRPLRAEEEKERVARVRATSAPSLPAVVPARKQARFFRISSFLLALTRLLSRTPRGLLSLGESPLGVLFEKAGLQLQRKNSVGHGGTKVAMSHRAAKILKLEKSNCIFQKSSASYFQQRRYL